MFPARFYDYALKASSVCLPSLFRVALCCGLGRKERLWAHKLRTCKHGFRGFVARQLSRKQTYNKPLAITGTDVQ